MDESRHVTANFPAIRYDVRMKPCLVRCPHCDKRQSVTARQAGSTIRCTCGCEIVVGSLSELRSHAGLESYEKPASEKVLQLIFDEQLPTLKGCIHCEDPQSDLKHVVAVCERSYQQTQGQAVVGMIGGIPFYLPLPAAETGKTVGRNVAVPLAFHICNSCCKRTQGSWISAASFIATCAAAASTLVALLVWIVLPLYDHQAFHPCWIAYAAATTIACFLIATITSSSMNDLKSGSKANPPTVNFFNSTLTRNCTT